MGNFRVTFWNYNLLLNGPSPIISLFKDAKNTSFYISQALFSYFILHYNKNLQNQNDIKKISQN